MNKSDNEPDADLARNVALLRLRMDADVSRLKASLATWIDHNSGPEQIGGGGSLRAKIVEISAALLETAIDHYIRLHDAPDALDLIQSCFRRQAEKFRASLQ
jgi:hypothetical protein